MYENKTEYVILNNMLDKVTSDVTKTEGTLIYDALSPVACELAKHYIELDSYIKRGFIQTSWGRFLDLRAAEHGLYRKSSTKATADLLFVGTSGTVIPKGTAVQTAEGKVFTTDASATLTSTSIWVTATAEASSPEYNLLPNTITQLVNDIPGITSVTNQAATEGGGYGEDDASFQIRVLDAVRNPGASGNVADYLRWASEVDGVGLVRVNPLWGGAGTVGIVILDMNRDSASEELIAKVASHIEEERPIGATVTVSSGIDYKIGLHAHVILDGTKSLASVTSAISAQYAAYFKEITFIQTYASYQKICAMVLNTPGVKDFFGLTLHPLDDPADVTVNVSFAKTNVPRIGTIDIVEYVE